MKEPVKRLKQTIVIAIAFLILYTAVLVFIEQRHYGDLIMKDSQNKTESVRGLIEGYEKTAVKIGEGFNENENARVRLEAIRLADQIEGGEFTGDRFSENSMVVRVRGQNAELPPEAEGLFPMLTADMITDEYVQTRTEKNVGTDTAADREEKERDNQVILTGGRIAGDWYLVRWTPVSEYDAYIRSRLSEDRLAQTANTMDDVELFMVSSSEEQGGGEILYKTKGLTKFETLDELGISGKDLGRESFSIETSGGKEYICFPIEMASLGMTAVCCNSVEEEKAAFLGDTIAQVFFAAVMLAGLITWCYSVQWLVRRSLLNEKARMKYSPEAVKKRTARLTIMAVLVITLFGFTTVMVQYMYQENQIGSNVLDMLEAHLDDGASIDLSLNELDTHRYVNLGETVSAMIARDPELLRKEKLEDISEAISAEYLILFDENGNETACSRDYTGFALPSDKADSLYDFRRLLKGVSNVVHDSEKDMITGETRSFVGIRYDIPGKEGTYGALLIALPSESADAMAKGEEEVAAQIKQQVYDRMQTGDRIIMEIDPETHKVLSSSKETYAGADIESLGMDPRGLRDRYMNFYYLDDEWYFGIAGELRNKIYFCLKDSTDMSRIGLLFALVSGGLFLVGYALCAKFALAEYTEENYQRYTAEMEQASEEYMKKIAERAPSLNSTAAAWRNMLPEMKAKTIMQILTGIMLTIMILAAFTNSPLARHSVLTFVMRGNWTKGINLFSVIAVLVTFCVEYLAYLVLKVVCSMLNSLTDLRGETVLKLTRSFLNYAMFIGAVCVSLSFLGVDTATLLASIGLLSLAISLGAKDIVADILAGLSIVFERTYFVGDIIQIGDFKGKVLEIGVRSTKLVNGTRDVKTISNHEISSVINYSKQTTICVVRIGLPVTVSVDEIKKLFEEELPEVRKINPHITKGPKYDGIAEFDGDKMIISISAEGPEEHIHSIRMDLNQVLQSMAERELLQYAQSNITINLEGAPVSQRGTSELQGQPEKTQEEGAPVQESGVLSEKSSEDNTGKNAAPLGKLTSRFSMRRGERGHRVIRGFKKDKK